MPDPREVDAVFAALADATRRDVVRRLAERPSTATELSGELPVTRQAVAKHLGVLDAAGLVTPVRQGRETRYHLTPQAFTGAVSWIAEVGGRWDRRLAKLERIVAD